MRLNERALQTASGCLAISLGALLALIAANFSDTLRLVAVSAFAISIPTLSLSIFLNLHPDPGANRDPSGISIGSYMIGILATVAGVGASFFAVSVGAGWVFLAVTLLCVAAALVALHHASAP